VAVAQGGWQGQACLRRKLAVCDDQQQAVEDGAWLGGEEQRNGPDVDRLLALLLKVLSFKVDSNK